MQSSPSMGSLIAAATLSHKTINQDAYAIARNTRIPLAGVIVADGLGSHYGSEIGSRLAAAGLKDSIEEVACTCEVDMIGAFEAARERLVSYVDCHVEDFPSDLDRRNAFGTTLLSAVETPNEIAIGYLGNGGIFHIRGNFNAFPISQLLPWTAVNYLNPHSLPQGGKNLLYKLLSVYSQGAEVMPSVLTIRKDIELFGDILLVCSDGIYSYDQTPMGRDDQQHVWISGEDTMVLFFEALKSFFEKRTHTDEALQLALEEYLRQLESKGLVTDDCTLGVLVTDRALRYQESLGSMRPNGAAQ